MERTIRPGSAVAWPALLDQLAVFGERPIVRMIDGLPAFPDEVPGDDWQELRLGLAGGMVTLRRTPAGLGCVTWGAADDALRRSWDRLCLAVATVADGQVVEGERSEPPAEFAKRVGLA